MKSERPRLQPAHWAPASGVFAWITMVAAVVWAGPYTTEYTYDAADRLQTVVWDVNGTNAAEFLEYDAAGNRSRSLTAGIDNPALDTDMDSLPDLQELVYFSNLDQAGAGDPDADGLSNSNELAFGSSPILKNTDGDSFDDYGEWVADTDPSDSNDWFRISAISNEPPFRIHFTSSSNRNYTLGYSTNLASNVWGNLPGQGPRAGTGGQDSLTDTNGVPQRFYRIEVQLP